MSINNTINYVNNTPISGKIPPNPANELQELRFDVNKFFSEYNASQIPVNAYYPILQKRLAGSLKNISIEGNMMTDYSGSPGESATHGYSLIQVGKASSGLANALGGYGVAWKPLVGDSIDSNSYDVTFIKKVGIGEYEITLTAPYPAGGFPLETGYIQIPYRDTSTFVFVSIQFLDYLEDGLTIRCLSGNIELMDSITGYENVAIYMVKPNVFIVDFTSSVNDINLWDNLSDEMGFLSFVNCGVANIQPNLDYKFTLTITDEGGIEFAIEDPAFSITGPARIPMYEYVAAEDTDSIGISVYGTDGYKWYYDNIRITNLEEQYPYLYCMFTTDKLREEIYVKAAARGYKDGGLDTGMKIYVCNSLGEWILIGYNTGETIESIVSDVIVRDDYTFRGTINVILIGSNPGDFEGNSILDVDSVSVENSESVASHLGGFVDVYIDALCVETTFTEDIDTETGSVYVDNASRGIVHIIEISRSDLVLTPGIDYTLGLDQYSYTCRGSITIATKYSDGDITIKALACPGLVTINDALTKKNINPINYDMLVKHRMVHYLDIAGSNRATVLPYLSSYIETLPRVDGVLQFSYAQFIFYLLQNGITTRDLIILDNYVDNNVVNKDYIRSSDDTIYLNKISCFRVSSG